MSWIKMREDLHEDPAVLWMAQQLKVRPETVVGYCHRFWGLVSRQTGDGCLVGPTLLSLGDVIGLPGFPELLLQAEWLDYDESGDKPITRIPKFERHLSEGAKARALASEKKRRQRLRMSPHYEDKCPKKTGTREEKRREDNTTPIVPFGDGCVEEKKSDKSENKSANKSKPKFTRPTLIDVATYCIQRSNGIDPQEFLDHYDACGWRYGSGTGKPIQDWQAAVRTWENRRKSDAPKEAPYV